MILGDRFLGQTVELSASRVALDNCIETSGLKFLKPRAKAVQFSRAEMGDGFLDVFHSGHATSIASSPQGAKWNAGILPGCRRAPSGSYGYSAARRVSCGNGRSSTGWPARATIAWPGGTGFQ